MRSELCTCKSKTWYHKYERTLKSVSIVAQSITGSNTTNAGGGAGDSGSSHILLPQEAKTYNQKGIH